MEIFIRIFIGNFEGALNDYSESIRLDPKQFKSYVSRSFCYEKIGQLDRALQDTNMALLLQPDNSGCLANRALIYEKLGRITIHTI